MSDSLGVELHFAKANFSRSLISDCRLGCFKGKKQTDRRARERELLFAKTLGQSQIQVRKLLSRHSNSTKKMFSSQGSLRQELDDIRREIRALVDRLVPLEASSTAVTAELDDLSVRGEQFFYIV